MRNLLLATLLSCVVALLTPAQSSPRIVTSEFIYEHAPFPSAHASTIAETPSGLVAAWFGGSHESAPDVGIWVARKEKAGWSAPVEVATGADASGTRLPCWNPVLFADRTRLLLFYKVGPNPREWWGMLRTSTDDGRTWSPAMRLPDGVLGPIKNKLIALADGTWLSPSSTEAVGDGSGPWRVHFERSTDAGRTWSIITPSPGTTANQPVLDAIQPSLLQHANGRLQAIGRTRQQRLFTTWSDDRGRSWTPLTLLDVPNPNAGIDAVTLRNGQHLLVYNPTTGARTPLSVATSTDGVSWTRLLDLETEPGEYSYPAVIQTRDGHVHITYTWRRERIKHVEIEMPSLQ